MIEALLQQDQELVRAKINSETGKIPWQELQRFFAGGNSLFVASSLDLVEVACAFQQDHVDRVKRWTDSGVVSQVTDSQAQDWISHNSSVWAVVVKPWVLVQTIDG